MNALSQQISKHFHDVHFGVNWTWSNMQDVLEGVTLDMALNKSHHKNSIADLVFHSHYYVREVLKVLKGGKLEASDKYCYDTPSLTTEEDWLSFKQLVFTTAREFIETLAQLPDDIWFNDFDDGKYGNYYRNISGIIEHTHYHLGQIALLKKQYAIEM